MSNEMKDWYKDEGKLNAWERVARYVSKVYAVETNLMPEDPEDTFFRCPDCDEPLFECDWAEDEDIYEGICPVCGFNFYESEE